MRLVSHLSPRDDRLEDRFTTISNRHESHCNRTEGMARDIRGDIVRPKKDVAEPLAFLVSHCSKTQACYLWL